MIIDTQIDREPPTDHPVFRELDQTEKAIYWSAVLEARVALTRIEEFVEKNGELDSESSELSQTKRLLQDSLALTEMMEELAEWRQKGVLVEASDNSGGDSDE